MGDGFDAAEIVFERNVFIGGVGVFVGEAESEQNARYFEGVVHLRDKRDGTAFANENGFFAEAFFQSRLGLLKMGLLNGATQGFPVLKTSNLQ